jgi:hypothetical protein
VNSAADDEQIPTPSGEGLQIPLHGPIIAQGPDSARNLAFGNTLH